MHIGQLAKLSGTKVETIRYYEKEGLLPAPTRELSGYRKYAERGLQRLTFITRGRALGFGLAEIRDLIALEENPDLACADVDRIARHHREQLRAKIAQLRGLEHVLDQLVADCHGGRRADCVILQALHQRGSRRESQSIDHGRLNCRRPDQMRSIPVPVRRTLGRR